MIYFTSDLHLGHKGIIERCKRDFESVQEMDEILISNLNERVKKQDVLYLLGDFCLGGLNQCKGYRDRIVCPNIHLIKGNHDRLSDTQYKRFFSSVSDIKNVTFDNQNITLCHYAMRTWYKSHKGAWQLFGHSHGKLAPDISLSWDVGVDANGLWPISLEQIRGIMALKKEYLLKLDRDHLSAEIAALDSLLAHVPTSDFLGRVGLESRKKELTQR